MTVTGEMIAAKAKELLTMGRIPYVKGGKTPSGMDCIGLVVWTLLQCGMQINTKGTNDTWRNGLSEKGSIEDCTIRWGNVPIGALIFIRDFDGGEKERGYIDNEGNAWHVYIKIDNGILIHASASNERVCTRRFADKDDRHGGPNAYGLAQGVAYTGKRQPGDIAPHGGGGGSLGEPGDARTPVLQPGSKAHQSEPGPGEAKVITTTTGLLLRKEPKEKAANIKEMPIGAVVKVLDQWGEWTKVRYVHFDGMPHEGWCKTRANGVDYLQFG